MDELSVKKQSTADRFADWEDNNGSFASAQSTVTKLLNISAAGFLITWTQKMCLKGGKLNKECYQALLKRWRFISLSPHLVHLQSVPSVSVGTCWKRDARDWHRSRSATFTSSRAISASDSFVKFT